jgi:long-subunit fatty acid transport protein
MKNILAVALIIFSLSGFSQDVGLELGFGSFKAKATDGTLSESTDSYSGVTTGFVVNFILSKSLKLETGLGFAFRKYEGESDNSWGIPVIAKYYTNASSGFHLRAGLGYSATLEDVDTTLVKKDALSAGFGFGYDIDDNFTIVAEYSTQLSNSLSPNAGAEYEGITVKGSGFGVSIQYFF